MITSIYRRFAGDVGAQTAILFSLMLIPILFVSGFAIDTSRQLSLKQHLQKAADAAALAGARSFMHAFSVSDAQDEATNVFQANIRSMHDDAVCTLDPVTVSASALSVYLTASCAIPTMMGVNFMGLSEVHVDIASTAAAMHKTADVVMMFDLSRSMNASDLNELKAAGKRAAEIVIGAHPVQRGRVAIAPFASGVNAGDFGNKASGRVSGADPERDNRARPSATIERVCVTERTGLEAFTDAAPDIGDTVGEPLTRSDALDLYRLTGDPYNPSEAGCPDSPIHPLDEDLSAVKTAIDDLQSSTIANRVGGNTAGHLGIAWSWYLISPRWSAVWTDPIYGGNSASAPLPYGDPDRPKIAILMTDGLFQYGFRHPFFSYDYTTQVDSVNDAARQLCANMRAEGILIYAIGLGINAQARGVLEDCTDASERVFTTTNSTELTSIYEEIAREFLGIGIVE